MLITAGLAAPAKSDTTPPELHSITFSRETVAVSGLQTKLLVVSARLTDDTEVVEQPFFPGQESFPAVRINNRWVVLSLVSGTKQDGIWTGGVAVTSDWASGTYEPDQIFARDSSWTLLDIDPSTVIDVPSIEVTSSNKPVLTLTFSPQPAVVGGSLTRTVRVIDRDSGQPLQGVPVTVNYDNSCAEGDIRSPDGLTNASGVYNSTFTNSTAALGHCAWITSDNIPEQPATIIAPTYLFPNYRWSVTARPASTSVPAGTNVAVTGTLEPDGSGTEVQLQRLTGSTWRTVNRGTTGGENRFSILATPPGVGTYSYRALAPGNPSRTGATSPVFTIRGT